MTSEHTTTSAWFSGTRPQLEAQTNRPGPIYIRLAKGFDPIISRGELGFEIGKAIPLRVAAGGANRALLVSTGVATTRALAAAGLLEAKGIECTVLHTCIR